MWPSNRAVALVTPWFTSYLVILETGIYATIAPSGPYYRYKMRRIMSAALQTEAACGPRIFTCAHLVLGKSRQRSNIELLQNFSLPSPMKIPIHISKHSLFMRFFAAISRVSEKVMGNSKSKDRDIELGLLHPTDSETSLPMVAVVTCTNDEVSSRYRSRINIIPLMYVRTSAYHESSLNQAYWEYYRAGGMGYFYGMRA